MSVQAVNKTAKEIFIYISLLFILLLTLVNITSYLKPKVVKVLGTETQNSEAVFWQDFLTKNPNYIPGWIEISRNDKAKEIDPNYELGISN